MRIRSETFVCKVPGSDGKACNTPHNSRSAMFRHQNRDHSAIPREEASLLFVTLKRDQADSQGSSKPVKRD